MTKSRNLRLKFGRNFDHLSEYYKEMPIDSLLEFFALLVTTESAADPFGIVEEVLSGCHDKLVVPGVNSESLLLFMFELLQTKEKVAFIKYVDLYIPCKMIGDKFVFFRDRRAKVEKNWTIKLSLSDILKNMSFKAAKAGSSYKFISESPKLAELVAKEILPQHFNSIGYHQLGSQAKKNRRRIALLTLMTEKLSEDAPFLIGDPGTPRRAASIASVLLKGIDIMKKNDAPVDVISKAWKEDSLFLKSQYFDYVLHLGGVKWPRV